MNAVPSPALLLIGFSEGCTQSEREETMRRLFRVVAAIQVVFVLVIAGVLFVGQRCRAGPLLPVGLSLRSGSFTQNQMLNLASDRGGFYTRGRWLVFDAEYGLSWEIFLVDKLAGQVRQLTHDFASDRVPMLSPDGTQVAFVSWRNGNSDIFVLSLATSVLRNLSSHPAHDLLPVWSLDSSILAFVSNRDGNFEIYMADMRHGLLHNLTRHPAHDSVPVWKGHGIGFKSDRDGGWHDYYFDLFAACEVSQPHVTGLTDGISYNWWEYIIDPNRVIQ